MRGGHLALALWLAGCASSTPQEVGIEASERLPGGSTTNDLLLGANAYSRHVPNILPEHESSFFSGNSFFNLAWVQAPASTAGRDGLGPVFNARSCAGCHFKDGRGRPPLEADEDFVGLLLRIGNGELDDRGAPMPDEIYGGQLQPFAIEGVTPEATPRVTYEEIEGTYADGTPYTLLAPTYTIENWGYGTAPKDLRVSPRVAPVVAGSGLLESIPEADLHALADPDDQNGDGISGRPNLVWDVEGERVALGRFGWKAEQPTSRQQSAAAFNGDLGVTSSMFPQDDCTPPQEDCRGAIAGGTPELDDPLLDDVEAYLMLLAIPVRTRWEDQEILEGKRLFFEVGCESCHTAKHQTGENESFPELSNQTIWPYTDLLLHDMGDGLSDGRPSFESTGNEWRTPPLWALRFIQSVNKHDRLLHDGRARGVAEAILWHGGEAESARTAFKNLNQQERKLLVDFVNSL
ncbi:MAG: thiol oxidoreductase [Myxococcales bacterium]|nr:thiol oxidoreductase [Myxococcales bacterium]